MHITTEHINPTTTKHFLFQDEEPLSFANWIETMKSADAVITLFNQTLKDSKFSAFFWEVKPITKNQLDDKFEFVLVKSNALESINENGKPFEKFFKTNEAVVSFPSLRGDAELIVPTPVSKDTQYAHLANFVRTADADQIQSFWRRVATIYEQKIGDEPKWLSTSGLGVYWLHARVDSRPKYYQHLEYKI